MLSKYLFITLLVCKKQCINLRWFSRFFQGACHRNITRNLKNLSHLLMRNNPTLQNRRRSCHKHTKTTQKISSNCKSMLTHGQNVCLITSSRYIWEWVEYWYIYCTSKENLLGLALSPYETASVSSVRLSVCPSVCPSDKVLILPTISFFWFLHQASLLNRI